MKRKTIRLHEANMQGSRLNLHVHYVLKKHRFVPGFATEKWVFHGWVGFWRKARLANKHSVLSRTFNWEKLLWLVCVVSKDTMIERTLIFRYRFILHPKWHIQSTNARAPRWKTTNSVNPFLCFLRKSYRSTRSASVKCHVNPQCNSKRWKNVKLPLPKIGNRREVNTWGWTILNFLSKQPPVHTSKYSELLKMYFELLK